MPIHSLRWLPRLSLHRTPTRPHSRCCDRARTTPRALSLRAISLVELHTEQVWRAPAGEVGPLQLPRAEQTCECTCASTMSCCSDLISIDQGCRLQEKRSVLQSNRKYLPSRVAPGTHTLRASLPTSFAFVSCDAFGCCSLPGLQSLPLPCFIIWFAEFLQSGCRLNARWLCFQLCDCMPASEMRNHGCFVSACD